MEPGTRHRAAPTPTALATTSGATDAVAVQGERTPDLASGRRYASHDRVDREGPITATPPDADELEIEVTADDREAEVAVDVEDTGYDDHDSDGDEEGAGGDEGHRHARGMGYPVSTGIGPCRNCGHHVSVTASRCRSCGYDADPTENERARTIWGISSLAATLTIVGAPVGLVLLWKAYQHHRAATGWVVDAAYPPAPSPSIVLGDCRRTLASATEHRRKSH